MLNINDNYIAALATYKVLYDGKEYKNQYYLLAEFIKYIIADKKLYYFTADKIKEQLNSEFGFSVPLSVVYTAIRTISSVEKINKQFILKEALTNGKNFVKIKEKANADKENLKNQLVCYISNKRVISNADIEKLFEALVNFLLDKDVDEKYQSLISSFVLQFETDDLIGPILKAIREGLILFNGIRYNIIDTGSIRVPLTLFLDMEILFDLAGYNGEIFKEQALDLINIAKNLNKKEKMVSFKYFRETQINIQNYFSTAESYLARPNLINTTQTAMVAIINGCQTSSQILEKKVRFFNQLEKQYGILLDDNDDYYQVSDHKFNLEDKDIYSFFGKDNGKNSAEESIKYLDHINKLRKNVNYNSDITALKYFFVTRTKLTMEISKYIIEREPQNDGYIGQAIHLYKLINILWFKTQRNFAKADSFPVNIDSAYKAKIILANFIKTNVSNEYKRIREQCKEGTIDKEIADAQIRELMDKPLLPDNIELDYVDDILDFSQERLNRKEIELKKLKNELESSKKENEKLTKEKELLKKDNSAKDVLIVEQEKQIRVFDNIKWYLNRFIYCAKWFLGLYILVFCLFYFFDSYVTEFLAIYFPDWNKYIIEFGVAIILRVGWKCLCFLIKKFIIGFSGLNGKQ